MHYENLFLKLRVAAMTISGFFISCLGTLLLLPLIITLVIYSRIMFIFIKLKLGNKFTRPGGLDVLQGLETFRSRPYINATARYDGRVDIDKLRQKFLHLIYNEKFDDGQPMFRKLRQIFEPCYGYHIFRDVEDFDIKNHIKKVTIRDIFPERYQNKSDQNGFKPVDLHVPNDGPQLESLGWERIMQRLLSKFGIRPVEAGLPQWELFVLEEETEHTTILFKVNHGYTDGIYFLRFFLEYVADRPVRCFLPYNYHQPNWKRKFLDGFWAFCLMPFGISRLSFPYENNPFHGPEISGDKMYLVSKSFPLKLLKEIKAESKVSVNAVLFSCLSNALATHFVKKKSKVPYVIVLVPISLQDMETPVKLKNRFGLKGILLPTFIDQNSNDPSARDPQSPLERIKVVQSWIDNTKNDPSFLAIHWLCVLLFSLLPTKYFPDMLKTKGITTTLSNVAGPQDEDHYMTGVRKSDFAFWIPDRNPLGVGVSVAGYKGNVRIGLMIDKTLLDNDREGYEFLEYFLEEIHTLHDFIVPLKGTKMITDNESTKLMMDSDIN